MVATVTGLGDRAKESAPHDDARRKLAASRRFLGSIRARLLGIVALFGVALVAMVATLTWMDARDIYAGRQDELRTVIEVAYKVVQQQYDEFKKGTISEAEAQQRAKAGIRAMRYNADDYFFVQDKNVVTHRSWRAARPRGRRQSKKQDPTGKYFSVEMNKVATEKGEGFVDYQYAKPGAPLDQPSPKLSYVKLFAPWQWVAGHRHIRRRRRGDDLGESAVDGGDGAGVPSRHRRVCELRHVPPVESSHLP